MGRSTTWVVIEMEPDEAKEVRRYLGKQSGYIPPAVHTLYRTLADLLDE